MAGSRFASTALAVAIAGGAVLPATSSGAATSTAIEPLRPLGTPDMQALGATPPTYLGLVGFGDGGADRRCENRTIRVAVMTAASGAAPDADIHMNNPFAAAAVRSAIGGAVRRLTREGCRDLLREFKDAEGHTLQANLEARHRTAQAQLQALHFEDGVSRRLCDKNGIHAVTRPGSSVVYVCSDAFLTAYRRNSYLAESYMIHELLHTLGLGENPPSSQYITDRVVTACHN